jgi:17-hydroxy-3-oxo-4-pregnene-20-carboxyl-CoA lyase
VEPLTLRDRAAIAGIGQTEFSKASGRSELQLAAEASWAAIADAGLRPSDIDGMVTFAADTNDELELMNALGIPVLHWTSRTPGGGGHSAGNIQLAAAAVASGAARAVLVYRAFNERSGRRFGQPQAGVGGRPPGSSWNMYLPYGLDTPAKMYSLWFAAYMQRYGVTNQDLGRYTVVARQYAATNPNAWFYGRPITLADHQASRWIVEPVLRLLDCCQESDGGVAMVVTTAERARDLRQPPVLIAAATQSHTVHGDMTFNYWHPDLTEHDEARHAAEVVYRTAGIGPDDVDVAVVYENFSPVVFLQLEAFGFCGKGEAKDFIADGHIGPGGSLPVNPHGGLLGEGYIHGMNNVIEGTRQLRGTAANQVDGAGHVLVASGRSAIVLRGV